VAGCSSTSGDAGSQAVRAGAATRSDAALQTFEIVSTWTEQRQPTFTQRRVVDSGRHLSEIFPSSRDGGSTPDITDGNTSYVSLTESDCNGVYGSGVKWARVANPPLSAAGTRWTDPFDYPLTAVSPAEALAALGPIVTAIRSVGRATIDGVSATKFVLTVSSAQMESFMARGQMGAPDPLVRFAVAMWVDASNHLRRAQITVMVPGQSNETVTNRYSHFGMPVNISVPPASEVVQKCG
jgi:hypothetical protein